MLVRCWNRVHGHEEHFHRRLDWAGVAAFAGISRATAYRYFSTTEALVREALLDVNWDEPEVVLGGAVDARERVRLVQRYLFQHTRIRESAHRLFLAKTLETWVAEGGKPKAQLRGARRLPMYEKALEPARDRLSEADFQSLLLALSAASGIESYIALKDVCGVDDTEADRIAEIVVMAIVDHFLPVT